MQENNFLKRRNQGQAMIVSVVYFVFISLSLIFGIISPSIREHKISNINLNSKKAYYGAESGIEDAIYRIRNSKKLGGNTTINLNNLSINTVKSGDGIINFNLISTGNILNYERQISANLLKGTGVSLNYGLHVGAGGIIFSVSGKTTGDVYSLGPISGADVTPGISSADGIVVSAKVPITSKAVNQIQEGEGQDFDFGSASLRREKIAQSFTIDEFSPITEIKFKIKKRNEECFFFDVNIFKDDEDNNGSPASNDIFSKTINAKGMEIDSFEDLRVKIEDVFLMEDELYWLTIEPQELEGGYCFTIDHSRPSNENQKLLYHDSERYQEVLFDTEKASMDFEIFAYGDGYEGSIGAIRVGKQDVSGTYAQANAINDVVAHEIKCSTGQGRGFDEKELSCQAELGITPQTSFPIRKEDLDKWAKDAEAGGVCNPVDDNYVGPCFISGDWVIEGQRTVRIEGPILVKGNVVAAGNATVNTTNDTNQVIISQGTLELAGTANFNNFDNGLNLKSFILFASTKVSTDEVSRDFVLKGTMDGNVIVFAPYSWITLEESSNLKQVMAFGLKIGGDSVVEYSDDLLNTFFSGESDNFWEIKDGWREQ